jgi:NADH dehydrogenase
MNIPRIDLPRVVILGAGFAGLQVARRLNPKHYQVVLIDQNNYHTFQPLIYQVASAGLEPDSVAYPIRKTLHGKRNTYFRMASISRVDLENKLVVTDIGDLEYDKLVIATGASNNFFGNAAVESNALPMKSLTDALDLRSKILGNFEQALNTRDLDRREELMNFVIVGGGATGVELAGALAELKNKILPKDFPDLDLRQMRIDLIEAGPRLLGNMAENSSNMAFDYLRKLGVHVWLETFVETYEDKHVITQNQGSFKTDTLIWAAGVKGNLPGGIDASNLSHGNRIVVDEYCQMPDYEDVYVVGDSGMIQSEVYPKGLPMLASVAMQQGKFLAKLFNRQAQNKSSEPFVYVDKGTMATIGRNKAVAEISKLKLQGVLAWAVWMLVHLMLLVGFRNRVVVLVNWAWNYVNYNNGLRLIVRPYVNHLKRETSAELIE